ncbi:MAG: hypothetical protein Q8P34_00740 [Bacteroidota bacterium]|nr:hypothetical protein [Bacteroidota bacterium]
MKKQITLEENETIEINGIVLTPTVIKQLRAFQENENELIQRVNADLAETVCLLVTQSFEYDGIDKGIREKKLLDLSINISYYREWFIDLQAPE